MSQKTKRSISNKKIAFFIFLGLADLILFIFLPDNFFISIFFVEFGILLYYYFYNKNNRDVFNPLGTFSFIWLFCIGVSNLELSDYQRAWPLKMWMVVLLSWIAFIIGGFLAELLAKKTAGKDRAPEKNQILWERKPFRKLIILLSVITIASYIYEVFRCGYIPILSENLSAYKDFGVRYIHYLTISLPLVCLLIFLYSMQHGMDKLLNILFIIELACTISIVSRQALLFLIVTMLVVYNYSRRKIKIYRLACALFIAVVLFSLMGYVRKQNLEYLYYVGEMNARVPKSIFGWPYLYISMSFENLKKLVSSNPLLEYGKHMFFPLFAFTLTKSKIVYRNTADFLVSPLFTASTYLYDVYLDFGFAGIIVLPLILGFISSFLYSRAISDRKNNLYLLLYCLVFHNVAFAFFSNLFSATFIVFYLAIILAAQVYFIFMSRAGRKRGMFR